MFAGSQCSHFSIFSDYANYEVRDSDECASSWYIKMQLFCDCSYTGYKFWTGFASYLEAKRISQITNI